MFNKKYAIASLAFVIATGIGVAVLSSNHSSKPVVSDTRETEERHTPDISDLDDALDNKDVKRAKDILKKLPYHKEWLWEWYLVRAAKLGDKELIQLVCKQGTNPTLALFEITTPQEGESLLKLGADMNYMDESMFVDTPVGWFVSRNDVSMVKWFLQHGANPNCQTGRRTPLLAYAMWIRSTVKCTPASRQEGYNHDMDAIIALIKRYGGKE